MVAQIIGFIALTVWVSSVQMKQKNNILIMQSVAMLFYATQYFLLGAISTGILNVYAVVRVLIFYDNEKKNKENTKSLLIVLSLITILLTVIFYENVFSLIPMVISLIYNYAAWQKNNKILRVLFIVAAFMWIIFNTYIGAYVALIGNLFEVISGIVAICRYDRKTK
ncbi:MAG: YgjV family protein [Clostridia bacterium]|nr:YgjV family protein [Clostridia bacterium]